MKNKNRKQTFFAEDTVHWRVKRIMLKKFLQAYIAKTLSEKLIIDAFAGVGRYGKEWPSEIDKYGSPLMVALDDCHRKAMKKTKKKNKEQKELEDISALERSEEEEIKGRPEPSGIKEKSHESEAMTSGEIETCEILTKAETQGEPEDSKTFKMLVDSGTQAELEGKETQEMTEEIKAQSGPGCSGARTELETLERVSAGGEYQEDNGNLTLAEYATYWNTTPEILGPIFNVWDDDKDGYVSEHHLQVFKSLFDPNGDDIVTLHEYEHYMTTFLECVYGHGEHGHGPNCDH